MHVTITRKLALSKAMTVAFCAALVVVIGWGLTSIRSTVDKLATVDQPLSVAGYELRIEAAELRTGVEQYAGLEGERAVFEKHYAQFVAALDTLGRLSTSPHLRPTQKRLRELSEEVHGAGTRMMDTHDGLVRESAELVSAFRGLALVLHRYRDLQGAGRRHPAVLDSAVDLEFQLSHDQAWASAGDVSPRRNRTRLAGYIVQGRQILDGLGEPSTPEESRVNADLRRHIALVRARIEQVLPIADSLHEDEERVEALQATIDSLVKEKVQPEAVAYWRESRDSADRTMSRVAWTAWVLAPLALVVTVAAGAWVWRSIDYPLKQLRRAVLQFEKGQLGYRVQLDTADEFAELGHALDRMAGQLENGQLQLRALTARIRSAQEQERAAIAREIHDQLGQTLTALKFAVSRVARRCEHTEPISPEEMKALCGDLSALVDDSVRSTRRVAAGLRPPVLDQLGLDAAIEWHLNEFERRTGIVCELQRSGGEVTLTPDRATACFRVLQEALTNVARHSRADHVLVCVGATGSTLAIVVRDNGVGLAAGPIEGRQTLGLVGMAERMRSVGGDVIIESVLPHGTRVVARLPLEVERLQQEGRVA